MNIPLDEVVHFDVITSSSTGAATDADSTPTFAVYEEATDTDVGVGGNLTKRTSLTGNYRGSFTASAANGFELGKWYSVIASATVSSVAAKAVAMRFRVVAAESLAGYPKSDQHALKGDAQSATDLKDFVDDGYDPSTNKVQGVVTTDALGAAYDAAKTAASQTSVDDLPTNSELATALAGADDATLLALSSLQTHGDSAWATATGFSQPGDQMDLVDAPNATAITAIQSGLSTLSASDVEAAVWDVAMSGHLGAGTTGDAIFQAALGTFIAPAVWAVGTRELTSGANLAIPDAAANASAVWGAVSRTLTAFAFEVETTISEEDVAAIAEASAVSVVASLSGVEVVLTPSPMAGGVITILIGDDYAVSAGQSFYWANDSWPVLTGGSAVFSGGGLVDKACVIAAPKAIRLLLTNAETALLSPMTGKFSVVATLPTTGLKRTMVQGEVKVTRQNGAIE